MLNARTSSGVTLIEMLIGVAILGILLMLGLPELRSWIADMQVKAAAQSVASGLQAARSEAIRRGTRVNFTFTTGSNWSWKVVLPNATSDPVRQGTASEGGATTKLTLTGLTGTSIAFSSLGRPVKTGGRESACSAGEGQCYFTVAQAAGGGLALQVMLEPGGSIRVCNPQINVTGDPRVCP
jgi:type IV fimbrial biogenesis protein FimT